MYPYLQLRVDETTGVAGLDDSHHETLNALQQIVWIGGSGVAPLVGGVARGWGNVDASELGVQSDSTGTVLCTRIQARNWGNEHGPAGLGSENAL